MKLSEILDITNIPEEDKPIDITLSGPENLFELEFYKLNDKTLDGLNKTIDKLMNEHDYKSNKKMLESSLMNFSESTFNTRNGYATYDEKTGKDTTGHFSKNRIIDFLTNNNTKKKMKSIKKSHPDKTWSQILFSTLPFFKGISSDTINDLITSIGLPELKKFTKSTHKKYFTDKQKKDYALSEDGTIKIEGKNILLTPLFWVGNTENAFFKKIMIKFTSWDQTFFIRDIWNSWKKYDFTSKGSKTFVLNKILNSFDWEEDYNGETLEEIQKIIKEELPKSPDSKKLKLFQLPETTKVLNEWIVFLSNKK